MIYQITYNPNDQITNLSEIYYKAISLIESPLKAVNSYVLTQNEYNDWLDVGLNEYTYVREDKYTANRAFIDNNQLNLDNIQIQKDGIIKRMIEINNLIPVYTDLGLSTALLSAEYSQLIIDYGNL